MESQKNNASRRVSARVNQLAKIAIFRDEYPLLLNRQLKNIVVGGAPGDFSDCKHFVTSVT
jgi:hypothetical protein